jgi:hypothetical protein
MSGAWQNELAPSTSAYLADQLDISDIVPASARPAPLTIAAAPPAAPSAAELLERAVRDKVGLVSVNLPDRHFPVWLRAGTGDIAAALKSLNPEPGGVRLPYTPRRILEIGAGAGYRSIALAQAYPDAQILTTESDLTRQRTALLNTLPYRNISCFFVCVSTDNARYAYTGRQGDAGFPALMRLDNGPITAQSLKAFLHGRDWAAYDTVIITPDAASDHLLRAPWPASVRLIAVETGGQPLHGATADRFPEHRFTTAMAGDYVLLQRREIDETPLPAAPVPIFSPDGLPAAFKLSRVPTQPPGFFPLGAHGFRLHPNTSEGPDVQLTISHTCRNYKEIHLTLRSALNIAEPIRFALRVRRPPGDKALISAAEILRGGETRSVVIPLPPYDGPCEVIFSTSMADYGDSNAGAWAEILHAAFV